jgi:putative pyoverdin transport system ATP-binding/permease protein
MSYLMRPIGNLLATLPSFSQAAVALNKIDRLGLSLSSQAELLGRTTTNRTAFDRIEISQATHTYRREGEESTFTLGPVDLKTGV